MRKLLKNEEEFSVWFNDTYGPNAYTMVLYDETGNNSLQFEHKRTLPKTYPCMLVWHLAEYRDCDVCHYEFIYPNEMGDQ